MYVEEEFLHISALEHLLFCERQFALIYIEGLWKENIFTAEGNLLHERVHQSGSESRKDLRVARGLWVHSFTLGLYGKIDLVEFKRVPDATSYKVALPGIQGFWQPFPVEYKRGRMRNEVSFEVQLCAQAICLEETLGTSINSGALYYGKTNRRMEIPFSNELRGKTIAASRRIHEIIKTGITPPARKSTKCKSCSLETICLPTLQTRRDVRKYIKNFIQRVNLDETSA